MARAKSRKITKPAIKSRGSTPKLGWGQTGKNINTIRKLEKTKSLENEGQGPEHGDPYIIPDKVSTGLSIKKYVQSVCKEILNGIDPALVKYVGLDLNEISKMISGREVNGEFELNYPDHFDMSVEEMWEYDKTVKSSVNAYLPGVIQLAQAQAGAM